MNNAANWVVCLVLAAVLGAAAAALAEGPSGKAFCVDARSVAATAPDGSPRKPFVRVQDAIAAAQTGDTVQVAAGVYAENITFKRKTVHLLGGYVGGKPEAYAACTAGDFTIRDPSKLPTTLRGDPSKPVVWIEDCGPSTLDGFTITGGVQGVLVSGWPAEKSSPTIAHNIIENNGTASSIDSDFKNVPHGGGVWLRSVSGNILNNVIRRNTANRGGGIAGTGPAIRVEGNVVEANVGLGDHGGGIYVASPKAVITHNLVKDNSIGKKPGYGWGAGIIVFNKGTVAALSYNTLTGNSWNKGPQSTFVDDGAEAVLDHELIIDSGWVYVDAGPATKATLINCTIVQTKPTVLHAIEVTGKDTTVIVKNCIFWGFPQAVRVWEKGSTLTLSHCLVPEQLKAQGEGAIEVAGAVHGDPLFAGPAAGDFHLKSKAGRWDPKAGDGKGDWTLDNATSPAIDAGEPVPVTATATAPATRGGRIELGCYGGTPEASRSPAEE